MRASKSKTNGARSAEEIRRKKGRGKRRATMDISSWTMRERRQKDIGRGMGRRAIAGSQGGGESL